MYLLLNLVAFMILGLVPAVVLFVLAGRWDLWNVWVAVGIFVVSGFFATLGTYRTSPNLLKERFKPATSGRVHWTTARAYLVLTLLQWIIAGLDQRFHWSDIVPLAGVAAGLVINAGPYAIVRHPGYATILLSVLASPLALNSLLSFIPAVIYMAVTVRVTAIEDRMLHDELAGYADYAAKVGYRLIPGIW